MALGSQILPLPPGWQPPAPTGPSSMNASFAPFSQAPLSTSGWAQPAAFDSVAPRITAPAAPSTGGAGAGGLPSWRQPPAWAQKINAPSPAASGPASAFIPNAPAPPTASIPPFDIPAPTGPRGPSLPFPRGPYPPPAQPTPAPTGRFSQAWANEPLSGTGPGGTGRLAKAGRFGAGVATAATGIGLSAIGDNLQAEGYAGGRPVSVLGRGMSLGSVGGPAAGLTLGAGLMAGDTGGQIATRALPGLMKTTEGSSNAELAARSLFGDPTAMARGLESFGDTGVGNWIESLAPGNKNFDLGIFADKISEGQRSLSSIPFENVPVIGGFLDGTLGDGGGQAAAVDTAAAARQAAAIPQNGEQFQALMTRLPFSPETVDATMKEYENTLTMNQIQAEQGQLFMRDDENGVDPAEIFDEDGATEGEYPEGAKFRPVNVDEVEAYTAQQFNDSIGDLWMGEQEQQRMLLDAAAYQASVADQFGGLMDEQRAVDEMFNGYMTNLNNSPLLAGLEPQYQMAGPMDDYMGLMQAAQQQRILDMQYQGSMIPQVQAQDALAAYEAQLQAARMSQGIQAQAQSDLTDVSLTG